MTFEKKSTLQAWMACSARALAGDFSGAASYAREAARGTKWNELEPIAEHDGWHVHALEVLSGGQVYVDSAAMVIAVSRGFWETLGHYGPARQTFLEQMTSGSNGMKFMTTDAGNYAEAARRQLQGTPVVAEKDAIALAGDQINVLLTQARDLNRRDRVATAVQMDAFTRRLLEVREDVEALEGQVARLRSGLELATEAVLSL